MYRAIRRNKVNSVLIILLFVAIIAGLGALASVIYQNWTIVIITLLIAGAYALIQYFAASRQALALTGAREVTEADEPRLYRTVEHLAMTTGTPMPRVFIINDPAPNAFATGRDPEHASVAATTGLLTLMDDTELEGVMAHELGHVRNYDIRVSMIVFGLVVAIGMLADWLLRFAIWGQGNNKAANPLMLIFGLAAMIVAPLLAGIVQAAISRQREYLADATGVMTTRYPEGLASALGKLRDYGQPVRRQNNSMAHMWFADPSKPGFLARLFATHPPLDDRIQRLRANADRF